MTRPGRTLARPRGFPGDEAGSVLVLWAISLVAILAFVALVFDMGRVQVTHGELQSYADSVALAAAGELDGNADAIARARAAAAQVASAYGGGASGSATYVLGFLSDLPDDDTAPIPSSALTTLDSRAAFAWVQVDAVNIGVTFLAATRSLLDASGGGSMPIAAEAVAGYTIEACDITPLMFCVPPGGWTANGNIGQSIRLRSGGNSAGWLPGAFGFLDITGAPLGSACEGENGIKNIVSCVLGAEENRTLCFSQRSVDVEPGQKVGIYNDTFNIRFDWFYGDQNKLKTDANFTAAPNIVQGYGLSCSNQNKNIPTAEMDPPDDMRESMGLPPDTNLVGDDTARFGNGLWDYDGYVDKNHGNNDGTFSADEDDGFFSQIPPGMDGDLAHGIPPTRYGVYVAETAAAGTGPILSDRIETGVAQCGARSTHTSRRVVTAAAIDCTSFAGDTSGNTKTGVPVKEFVELFMIRPVGADTGTPGSFDFWVEVIGSASVSSGTGTAGATYRSFVQLYR